MAPEAPDEERTLGDALTERLEAGTETQDELVTRLGASQSQISKWKTGLGIPKGTHDLRLMDFLEVGIEEYDRLIGAGRRKRKPPRPTE